MTLENLWKKLEEIEKKVNCLTVRVSWFESETESGLQLMGSGLAQRFGTVFDTQLMPTGPNEMKLFFVVKKDNGDVGLVPSDKVKFEG